MPAKPASNGIAAFDFDGTLVAGDSLRPYLIALLGRMGLASTLTRAAHPMVRGYAAGGRDSAKAALLLRALAGIPLSRAAQVGTQFGAELATRIKPDLADRLRWHQKQKHRLVLVSASLTVYLDEFGRQAGFDEVIATRLAVSGSEPGAVLTGALDGPNVRGPEKERRLRAAMGEHHAEVWAYGDSAGDREMLAMADHAYLVDGRRLTLRSNRAPAQEQWHR